MDTKEATLFIGNIKWQYAKTYPNAPHEYSVLDWKSYFSKSIVIDGVK